MKSESFIQSRPYTYNENKGKESSLYYFKIPLKNKNVNSVHVLGHSSSFA
jgi:hypothetical protein